MKNASSILTSAIAAQMKTKPYSHHAFDPKGTVPQSLERHEQNRAFCISGLIALRAILSITTMARKKSVLVANNGKVQSLQSSELALTTRSGVNGSNPLHVGPLYTG